MTSYSLQIQEQLLCVQSARVVKACCRVCACVRACIGVLFNFVAAKQASFAPRLYIIPNDLFWVVWFKQIRKKRAKQNFARISEPGQFERLQSSDWRDHQRADDSLIAASAQPPSACTRQWHFHAVFAIPYLILGMPVSARARQWPSEQTCTWTGCCRPQRTDDRQQAALRRWQSHTRRPSWERWSSSIPSHSRKVMLDMRKRKMPGLKDGQAQSSTSQRHPACCHTPCVHIREFVKEGSLSTIESPPELKNHITNKCVANLFFKVCNAMRKQTTLFEFYSRT